MPDSWNSTPLASEEEVIQVLTELRGKRWISRGQSDLLVEDIYYRRYVILAKFKPGLRKILREEHGIWGGSLFPDSAGAAQTAKQTFIATQSAIAASLDRVGEFEPRKDDDSPRLDSKP